MKTHGFKLLRRIHKYAYLFASVIDEHCGTKGIVGTVKVTDQATLRAFQNVS